MACNTTDFFMRRTGRLFFDKPSVDLHKEYVTQLFENQLNLDKKTNDKNEKILNENLISILTFN
jgi:glycerol-3-phosphate dehydrogenase